MVEGRCQIVAASVYKPSCCGLIAMTACWLLSDRHQHHVQALMPAAARGRQAKVESYLCAAVTSAACLLCIVDSAVQTYTHSFTTYAQRRQRKATGPCLLALCCTASFPELCPGVLHVPVLHVPCFQSCFVSGAAASFCARCVAVQREGDPTART